MKRKLSLLGIDFLKIYSYDKEKEEFDLESDPLWRLNDKSLENDALVDTEIVQRTQ